MKDEFRTFIQSCMSIGASPDDSEALRLKKSSLILVPIIIGTAAFLWGMIYIALDHYISASIPLSYSVISAFNLWHLHKTKNIIPLQKTQLILVLLLPFFLMWSLGGFALGSFVFIWAFFAPIAALTYDREAALYWFYAFLALVVLSTLIDQTLIETHTTFMPQVAIEIFFLLNISAGLSGLYFLIKHFIDEKEKNASRRLRKEHEALVQRTEELNKANLKLKHLALHDTLTQLPNRASLSHELNQTIGRSKRQKEQFAVFFIDLDKFKQINDSYGHSVGDQILIETSERLKRVARSGDTVFRLGGDEFVIIVNGIESIDDSITVANRIIQIFTSTFEINDLQLHLTPSIGIALYPENGILPEILLKNADTAMYRAKQEGRNNFSYYSEELTTMVSERIKYENMLRKALEREELSLRYQIQVDIVNQQIHGIEVLLRWHHPEEGMIPPSVFIPIAEDIGQIYSIGEWVLKKSCQFMKQLISDGFKLEHMSVNVSGIQFLHKQFVPLIAQILKETGLNGKHLELEITESVIMDDRMKSIEALHKLTSMGISLSIDDFGTGYSSLSYLKKLPVNCIKIDRSFIQDLPKDKDDEAITKSIIALGNSLNLEIIAEGVEQQEQVTFLNKEGCSLLQGYLFSHPISDDELIKLLKQPEQLFKKISPLND